MDSLNTLFEEHGIIIAYIAIFFMAIIPIYLGSHFAPTTKKEDAEFMSADDAKMFPLIGSAALFGLYLVFSYFNKDYVNYVLTAYFCILGVGSITTSIHEIFLYFTKKESVGDFTLSFSKSKKSIFSLKFGYFDVSIFVLAVLFSAVYAVTKHWILNNIYGLAFSITAIQNLNLDSFQTGMMLLSGLFVYDIFWVFGTEVMVTVAKNFDAPIKLLFPKNILNPIPTQFSMLGLGDIVLPGIYIALCLHFDYVQHKKSKSNSALSKPYFNASFVAYCFGLFTTVFVMHTFKAAQPALLYLSPACILSTIITGYLRGELSQVFEFNANPNSKKNGVKAKSDESESLRSGPSLSAGKRTKKTE